MTTTTNRQTIEEKIGNQSCSSRKRFFFPWTDRCFVSVAILALLVLGHVQGLTPSKPSSTRNSNPSNNRKSNNLSSTVSSDMGTLAAPHHKTSTFHRRGGQHRYPQHAQVSQVSIFVKNLHYQAEKSDIVDACQRAYGKVKSVWIPRDNKKKGYAKVEFETLHDAKEALANGRLNVLGRHAYLVEDTRPVDDKGDAFRYLAAFSKGDFDRKKLSVDKILRTVGKAGTPRSEKERGILAAALARIGARNELLKVLRWKNHRTKINGGASTSVYNSALSAMKVSTIQECKLAEEIVTMAEQGPGTNSRTYGTAIASIKRGAGGSDLSGAASNFLATAIAKEMANHVVYNELISCLGKIGAWKMATRVLDQMFEDESVEPTEVSLNSAIASCASAGQLDAAIQIYEDGFEKAKIQPTIVTTNSLLSTAHKWMKKRRSEDRESNNSAGLDPSDANKVLSFVRSVLADASKRGDQLDVVSINTLISAYGAAGEVQSAMKLFREACSKGVATTVTANAALSALALAGEVSKVLELVHKLDSSLDIRSDVTSWNTAISACGSSGDLENAIQLMKDMPHTPDAHSFVSLLSAVNGGEEESDKSSSSATSAFVNDLLERADRVKATTTFVLNAALATLDRLGDYSAVQLLFDEGFQNRGLSPDVVSYNTVIHSLGRNDPAVAMKLFSGMIEDSTAIQADEQTYCVLIAALANSGMHENALRIVQSSPPNVQKSVAMYNEALRACHGAAEPEAALELLQHMKSEGPEPNLVSTTIVMNTCASAGREYGAGFSLFEELSSPDLIAFNSAIALAEKSGDADKAISLLKRLARQENGISPDDVSFCSAIAACERGSAPRFRAALRLLKESIKAVGPNAACYIATVQTLAAAGEIDRALELLNDDCVEKFDSQSKYVLYRTVQVGCATAGDSVNADRLGKEMKDYNLKALAPLATARVGGRLRTLDNKIDSATLSTSSVDGEELANVDNTVQDLVQQMNHKFVTSALPIEFQAHSSQKSQEVSLANHAEKKALALLLIDEKKNLNSDGKHRPSFAALSVEINFKMCADCHDFFKEASGYLERRITVKEPTMLHVFEAGECSCNDSWRWEERHSCFEQQTETLTIPGLKSKVPAGAAAKHRFGRLPPLLKP